jgi:tRNA(fMet)-specific endonuclease VapC
VTLFAIESGVHQARDPTLERSNIARMLAVIALRPFDAEAALSAAAVRAALARRGAPIGPYDTLLAGHALALGAGVVTANRREFTRVAGLHVESWREPASAVNETHTATRTMRSPRGSRAG